MTTRIDPKALDVVAAALHPGLDVAPESERERVREDARELLQLARRQGRRQRAREAELRDELALVVTTAATWNYPPAREPAGGP